MRARERRVRDRRRGGGGQGRRQMDGRRQRERRGGSREGGDQESEGKSRATRDVGVEDEQFVYAISRSSPLLESVAVTRNTVWGSAMPGSGRDSEGGTKSGRRNKSEGTKGGQLAKIKGPTGDLDAADGSMVLLRLHGRGSEGGRDGSGARRDRGWEAQRRGGRGGGC